MPAPTAPNRDRGTTVADSGAKSSRLHTAFAHSRTYPWLVAPNPMPPPTVKRSAWRSVLSTNSSPSAPRRPAAGGASRLHRHVPEHRQGAQRAPARRGTGRLEKGTLGGEQPAGGDGSVGAHVDGVGDARQRADQPLGLIEDVAVDGHDG